MKKIFLLVSLLISAVVCFGQTYPIVPRSNSSVTVQDSRFTAQYNLFTPRYADTTAANVQRGNDSCSAVIFTYDVMSLWVRACSPKRWIMIGTALVVDTTNTVRLSGTGTILSPLAANARLSGNSPNALQVFPDGLFVQPFVQNGLRSGGLTFNESGLTYTTTAAEYAINNIVQTSPETQNTLSNADPSNPRLDLFVATLSGTIIVIEGTPAADPQLPSYDPTTQLPLGFVLVTTGMTEPTFCRDSIYYPNNGEMWTGAVSNASRINLTSTTNPYSVTQNVQFIAAQNNDQLRFTKSTTVTLSTYSLLILKIRSSATWASTSRILIQFYNGLTPLGIPVAVGDNTPFGFNSSNLAGYQSVAIQLSNFGSVVNPDNILITVSTQAANTVSFHLDNYELFGCNGVVIPTSGAFWNVGGNQQGVALVGGTLDNNAVQLKANNVNHTNLQVGGTSWMQGTNPGVSFFLGSFAAADYFIRRVSNTLTLNVASAAIIDHTIAGNSMYSLSAANGHLFNSSAAVNLMQLNNSTGALRLFNYGDNTFTGTATRWLAVDVNGNVIEQATPMVSASNGLTSINGDVQLGGLMTKTDTINNGTSGNYILNVLGTTNTQLLRIIQAGTGGGLSLTQSNSSFSSTILSMTAAVGSTGKGISTIAAGANAFTVRDASDNTVLPSLALSRSLTSGSAAVGIGTSITFTSQPGLGDVTMRIENVVTDITPTDEESKMNIWLNNSGAAVEYLRATLYSDGNWQWQEYGDGLFTAGTPTYALGVDVDGNVMEMAIGGGTGDVLKVGTPVNNQLGVWTGNGTIEGDANLTFASSTLNIGVAGAATGILTVSGITSGTITIQPASAAGTYTLTLPTDDGTSGQFLQTNGSGVLVWATGTGGSGTLTTISGVNTNGFSWSIANPTTTPALTLSTSITGIIKGVAGALTAAVSGTDYLPITGGAGITTLGTITTGTWNATTIGATFGGTAQTTYATGDVLYASGVNTLAKRTIGSNGQVFTVVAGVPQWSTPGTGGTVTSVGLIGPAVGITVSGSPITTAGSFILTLNGDLAAVEGIGTTGFVQRTAANTWSTVATINASTQLSGTLAPANGGTGFASGYTAGQILWASNATTLTRGFLNGTTNRITVTSVAGGITISHAFNPTEQVLTDAATTTWNVTNGGNAVWTNNGTGRTLTLSNVIAGYSYTLRLIQGSGGSKTVTTWTNVRWANGTLPTLATTAGSTDMITLYAITTTSFVGYFTPNVQ